MTLVRQGEIAHGDSLGHQGTIGAGDIQWMSSGSGILHEEMPQVRPEGIAGLQLWLNLPARDKMSRPKYRELSADGWPRPRSTTGARHPGDRRRERRRPPRGARRGAGRRAEVHGRDAAAGATFREPVPLGHTVFAYVDQGEVRFGPAQSPASAPALVIFGEGDLVEAAAGPDGGRFLLAAARPLHEPIARWGPFVMNTRAEIEQTLAELRSGRFIREEPRDA